MAEKKKTFMDLRRKRNTFSSRGFALLLMIGMLLSTILSPSTNVSANQIEGIESSSPYNSYNEPVINSPDEGLFSSATDFLDGQVNAFLESERESNLKISSNLASYLETGEVPDNIVSVNDNPRIISVVISGSDVSDFVKVESTIALSGLSWIIGSVSKPADLVKMSEMPGVLSISGDIKIANEYSSTDLTKFQSEVKDLDPIYSPENYVIRDIIGVTDMVGLYSDVDGSDVVIQIHDTGVDFGQTDLVDAFARDESGIPTVLDSAGNGFSFTVATLPDVSGYIATSSLDPETTEFIVGDGYQYVPQNYNLTDLGFEFLVAQDYELPSTVSSVSGDYKFGFLGQSTDSGYISIFPYILVDSVTSGVYDTIFVDLDTGLYASMKWVDDEDNTLTTKYSSYLDYSFEDEDAHKWGDGTEIMARDLDADGINDVSAGTLSNGIDIYGVIDEGTFFSGIFSDGSGISTFYDYGGHGTWCAAAAAGRGITPFKIWDIWEDNDNANDTEVYLPGVAPAAKIQASNGFALTSSIIYGELWSSGFEPDGIGDWYYTGNHLANVSSNSWGGSNFDNNYFADDFDGISIFFDILSLPGYLDASYPGVLRLTSTGNAGPGFGTAFSPGSSLLAMTVGASSNFAVYTAVFGEGQGFDQIGSFSSRGPGTQGNSEPDILNVGYGGFNPAFLKEVLGNGTEAYNWWTGTSLSCPLTAGSLALVFDAAATYGTAIDGLTAKNIVKSTAEDLGLTSFEQGAGQVDILRAVELAMGETTDANGKSLFTAGSLSTFEEVSVNMQAAWDSYYGSSGSFLGNWDDVDWPTTSLYDGSYDVIDASVFGGYLNQGDSWATTLEIADGAGAAVTGLTATAIEHKLVYTASAPIHSTEYRTDFNMSEFFDSSIFLNADLLKIQIAWDSDLTRKYTLEAPYLPFTSITDWNDVDLNGTADDWDRALGIGDELDVLSMLMSDYPAMVHTIGNPSTAFKYTPNVLVYDPLYRSDDNPNWAGTDFTVTIQAYSKEVMSEVSVILDSGTTWDVAIDVPVDAQPGIHEGFIVLEASGAYQVVPLSYTIVADVPNGPTKNTFGTPTNTPYDLGAFYSYIDTAYAGSGDWRYYILDVSAGDAKTLVFELNWTHPGTEVVIYVADPSGILIDTYMPTGTTDDRAQRMLLNVEGNLGLYTIALQVTEFNETVMAEPYNVSVSYLTVSKSELMPTLTLDPAEGEVVTGNLTAEWSPFDVPELPNLEITGTTLSIQQGYYYSEDDTMDLTSGTTGGWWDDFGMLDQCEKIVNVFLDEGNSVSLEVGWDQSEVDLDIFMFAPSVTDYTSVNSLVYPGMTTGANPETGAFIAPETGNYKLCLDWYSGGSGTLNVYYIVNALKGPKWTSETNMIEVDPYSRIADDTWAVSTYIDTNFNINPSYTHDFVFDLHSDPSVSWVTPVSDAVLTGSVNLEWAGTDPNPQDTLTYDVLYLSTEADEGAIWGTIKRGTSDTSCTYDFSLISDYVGEGSYYLKVQVKDGWTTNDIVDIITVQVQSDDSDNPVISGPADITFSEGNYIGGPLEWTISDLHPATIEFYIDDVLQETVTWDTATFTFSFDPSELASGVYTLRVVAFDTVGNSVSDEVTVTVEVTEESNGEGSSPILGWVELAFVFSIALPVYLYRRRRN